MSQPVRPLRPWPDLAERVKTKLLSFVHLTLQLHLVSYTPPTHSLPCSCLERLHRTTAHSSSLLANSGLSEAPSASLQVLVYSRVLILTLFNVSRSVLPTPTASWGTAADFVPDQSLSGFHYLTGTPLHGHTFFSSPLNLVSMLSSQGSIGPDWAASMSAGGEELIDLLQGQGGIHGSVDYDMVSPLSHFQSHNASLLTTSTERETIIPHNPRPKQRRQATTRTLTPSTCLNRKFPHCCPVHPPLKPTCTPLPAL